MFFFRSCSHNLLFWSSFLYLSHDVGNCAAVYNVLFVQYVYLATEQAETYFKICFLICHLTYLSEGIIYYSVALPAMCAAVVQIWRTCNVTGGGAELKVFLSADPASMSNSYSFQKSSFHLSMQWCMRRQWRSRWWHVRQWQCNNTASSYLS